ncbi:MAG TPA: hypothetical protein VN706_16490 [Gemmatimonadaceae bacterium]|nr:hypothetical protein [Gemmatimonadaceae bacterium]
MPAPAFIRNHKLATAITLVIAVPVIAILLWVTIALSYSYSSGDRAGYLQKLSRKGWLCKTWEGELLLTAMPGAMPEKFVFSVRSDSVAAAVNTLQGEHVVLHYEQHKGVPTSCFGETEYFVTSVRAVPSGTTTP